MIRGRGGTTVRRAFALLLATASMLIPACQRDDAQAALRATVQRMQQALEERQPQAFLQHIDPSFNGPEGLDKDGLHRLLVYEFLRNSRIGVSITHADYEFALPRARVIIHALARGGAGVIPQRLQSYRIDTDWLRTDSDWLLVGAQWRAL